MTPKLGVNVNHIKLNKLKKLLLVFVLAITMFTACDEAYDDSALTERIENLEESMAKLIDDMTTKLETLESQISKLDSDNSSVEELGTKILNIEAKLSDLLSMNTAITEGADQADEDIKALQDLIEDLQEQIRDLKENIYDGSSKFIGDYIKLMDGSSSDIEEIYKYYREQDEGELFKLTKNSIIRSHGDRYKGLFLAENQFLSSDNGATLVTISVINEYIYIFDAGSNNIYICVKAIDLERFKADRLAYFKDLPDFQEALISVNYSMYTTWTDEGMFNCKEFSINNNELSWPVPLP